MILILNPDVFRMINAPLLAYANNETDVYGKGV